MDLTAENLSITQPLNHCVKMQKYTIASFLTPNSFPELNRNDYKEMSVYGIKLYGCFETQEEQFKYCDKLQKIEKNHDIIPFDIRNIYEFDANKNDDEYKNTKIIYREEKLNNVLNNEFTNNIFEEKKEKQEEIIDVDELDNSEFDKFNSNEKYFNFKIDKQLYGCVVFFDEKMLKLHPHLIKDKKIPLFIVLGFFEKISDVQKFVFSQREKFPLIFTFEVGKWCAFDVNLMNNIDSKKQEERTFQLNKYMGDYLNALNKETDVEKERKAEQLTGSNIVSGKYDFLDEQDKHNKQKMDFTNSKKETPEEKLIRELKETQEEQQKLVNMSESDFEDNLIMLENINKILKS